jgi:hypothetical protein
MKKQCTKDKYAAMVIYLKMLHEKERIRLDDAISRTAQHFFCSTATVLRAMRMQKI